MRGKVVREPLKRPRRRGGLPDVLLCVALDVGEDILQLGQLIKKILVQATLGGHEGSPHNVAQAVLALVENDFITGASLPVDGGRSIYARGL